MRAHPEPAPDPAGPSTPNPVSKAKDQHVLIIGGGIVGLATAHQLLRQFPGRSVTILEKEDALGQFF